jgi:hypothetical protein
MPAVWIPRRNAVLDCERWQGVVTIKAMDSSRPGADWGSRRLQRKRNVTMEVSASWLDSHEEALDSPEPAEPQARNKGNPAQMPPLPTTTIQVAADWLEEGSIQEAKPATRKAVPPRLPKPPPLPGSGSVPRLEAESATAAYTTVDHQRLAERRKRKKAEE